MSTRPNEELNPLDQAAGWLARLRADDVSATDLREFSAWLAMNEANRAAFERMLELWRDLGVLGAMHLRMPETAGPRRR